MPRHIDRLLERDGLRRDGDALVYHSVVRGEYRDEAFFGIVSHSARYPGEAYRNILEPAEASGRLCKLALAPDRFRDRIRIRRHYAANNGFQFSVGHSKSLSR